MIKSLLGRALSKRFLTNNEPRKIKIGPIIRAPLAFIVFIVLISVGTNMMPFYSDGSRMDLITGLATVLLQEEGSFTAPYDRPEGGEAYTSKPPPGPESDFYLDDEGAWGIPAAVGEVLMVDNITAAVLFLLVLMMVFSFIINAFDAPFIISEKVLYKAAFNPKLSNTALRATFIPAILPPVLINSVAAFVLGTILINISVSDFEGQGFEVFGIVIHSFALAAIPATAFFWGPQIFRTRRFLAGLLSRRCRKCFHMDTVRVIDYKYVRTDVTTTTYYKTDSHGSRVNTRSSKSEHDVYDYTYECSNCGDTFVRRE